MRGIDWLFQDWLKPFKLLFCHFDLYFALRLQNTDESSRKWYFYEIHVPYLLKSYKHGLSLTRELSVCVKANHLVHFQDHSTRMLSWIYHFPFQTRHTQIIVFLQSHVWPLWAFLEGCLWFLFQKGQTMVESNPSNINFQQRRITIYDLDVDTPYSFSGIQNQQPVFGRSQKLIDRICLAYQQKVCQDLLIYVVWWS